MASGGNSHGSARGAPISIDRGPERQARDNGGRGMENEGGGPGLQRPALGFDQKNLMEGDPGADEGGGEKDGKQKIEPGIAKDCRARPVGDCHGWRTAAPLPFRRQHR